MPEKRRKKRRGGRPRKQNVPREANGRVSRTYEAASSYRLALEARSRIHGLSITDASDSRAGTVIGRMVLSGSLTRDQHEAAQRYSEVRYAYMRAIDAKPGFTQPLPEEEGEGDHESFCRRARQIFGAMMESLNELCVELRSPGPVSALEHFVNRDVYLPELEGDLRLALNRLVRHFFTGAKKPA